MAQNNKLKPQRVGLYSYHDLILGKGNFATVYQAHHKVIGCDVALKVINLGDIEEEYVSRNLTREARILRDLRHPNIVRLYETVQSVNLYCLALELVRGVDLYQYMKKQEDCRISEKLARVYFYQMLSAVEYMHRLHIIHRDLKQENILVESGHVIKIVDFGLSNIYYPCYKPRTHCGSVEYAAPELFRSQSPYGTAADLWSLGVILYAMVVGKMPFEFNREASNHPESHRKREHFAQRISKGLMQENWELMEYLSPDCWNLLHDLLQPDQFRRIRIEDALTHHWITKDVYLKKRLPQKRKDLQRKFLPEVVEYLAGKLNASVERIEKHVYERSGSKISCMFYIIRDVLMKDVLYPPKDFERSFLYRFECWRQNRSSLLSIEQNSDDDEYNTDVHQTNERKTTGHKSVLSLNVHGQSSAGCEIDIPISNCNSKAKKDVNYTPAKEVVQINVAVGGKRIKKIYRNTSMSKREIPNIENMESKYQKSISKTPYRSYKYTRPGKTMNSSLTQETLCKLPDVKINVNNFKSGENCEKEQFTSQLHELRGILTISKKNPKTPRVGEISSQSKIEDYSKIKVLTNKASKNSDAGGMKQSGIKDQKKSDAFPKNNAFESNNVNSHKKEDIITKVSKNSNIREQVSRPIRENGITLLTRKQLNTKRAENREIQKVSPTETSSRIPVKNMRYGPPAAFNQSSHALKATKSKRTTVADRIVFCRGDTNEN